jgi:acetyl esterase/lipase
VGLAGPYDFLPLESDELKVIFGPEPGRADTQPINHVDGQAPPMLLLADQGDKVVLTRNTRRMAAGVSAAGGVVEARLLPHLSHPLILGALAWPLRALGPVNREVMDFIRHTPDARR